MNAKKGFTLIEIMIVVAILAILAAVAIPNFMTYRRTAQANSCQANLKQIVSAIEAYQVKHGSVPSALADLTDTAKGAFLKKMPTCPCKGTYNMDTSNANNVSATCTYGTTDGTDYKHSL